MSMKVKILSSSFLILSLFIAFTNQANVTIINADNRCLSNNECLDPGTDQCCGFKHEIDTDGEKLFSCMDRTDAARLNWQCLTDTTTFCDYCAVGFYCCSYQTRQVLNLYAQCVAPTRIDTFKANDPSRYFFC